MADRNIDLSKANQWLGDVKTELESVNKLLEKVTAVTAGLPSDDDPFTKVLKETNDFLEKSWVEAKKGFNFAWEKVDGVLKEMEKSVGKAMDIIDDHTKKIMQ